MAAFRASGAQATSLDTSRQRLRFRNIGFFTILEYCTRCFIECFLYRRFLIVQCMDKAMTIRNVSIGSVIRRIDVKKIYLVHYYNDIYSVPNCIG